jgi:ATP-dependent helicase Lhr and Lhr-like helicase
LWQQRKRASDLLAVASRFGSFPALLETYREVLRDHFDMPALVDVLRRLASRSLRLTTIDSTAPSPFAASLLFSYVANYIYDGDAPLAERRAQALSVDQAQLRELLGDAELRELLDPESIETVEKQLQHLDASHHARTADALHDLLLRIGDLTIEEIEARSAIADTPGAIAELERARRIVPLPIAGEPRYVAVEDVARYRDALGAPMPQGLPEALLEPVRDPAGDLVLRYARSHGPFTARMFADRYGLGIAVAATLLARITNEGRIIEGEFRPGGTEREWVDADVLRRLRSRSLARLRQEVEPVDAAALTRFTVSWHGIGSSRRGHDALLDAIEQLQGAPIPASVLEREVLPARVADYQPAMLDTLMAAGEIIWVGVEAIGERDGRIALYLTDHLPRLRPPATAPSRTTRAADRRAAASAPADGDRSRADDILDYLRRHGASFFAALHDGTGGGFPRETVDALWDLVWTGLITNDTLHALRAFGHAPDTRSTRRSKGGSFRSRRLVPPSAEGRWSLVGASGATPTEWSAALAQQLLTRHGIVTRETAASESLPGGFGAVYHVLKAMEDAGRVRRGYFVAGLGGAQFAMPAALDRLRSMREPGESLQTVIVAATDPANPYGATLKWPLDSLSLTRDGRSGPEASARDEHAPSKDVGRGPTRTVGALVVLVDGCPAAYLRRGERELLLLVTDAEPQRSTFTRAAAHALMALARSREEGRRGMLIAEINGIPAATHPMAHVFVAEGFTATAMGLQARVLPRRPESVPEVDFVPKSDIQLDAGR